MCGICGIVGPLSSQSGTPQVIEAMLDQLYLRGPDDVGHHISAGVHMAMRRLAIIDIAGGMQPIQHAQTGVTVIFNGEIYNHQTVRHTLELEGALFSTNSDTEVLLHGYLTYGEHFLKKLNGMFSIAIWDPRDSSLLLARDHLGQKPLYFSQAEQSLLFASDLRCLLKHPQVSKQLNGNSLASYLQLRHVPGPETIIDNIEQLQPGEMLTYRASQPLHREFFWQPEFSADTQMTTESAVEEFESLWPSVIQRHLQSEVPIGAFLSGGIDSSLIVAEAIKQQRPFTTLSVAFGDQSFDESQYAKQVSKQLGSQHQTLHFDLELASLLEKYATAYDQPFADPAALPSLLMCEAAKQLFTVALSGDGGDELFAGYQRYKSALLSQKLAHIPQPLLKSASTCLRLISKGIPAHRSQRRVIDAVIRRLNLVSKDFSLEYQQQFQVIDSQLLKAITHLPQPALPEQAIQQTPLLSWMMQQDMKQWLPDQMLVKMDRASMASSLELRVPFLDREIVDFALRIPATLQIKHGTLKHLLRSVAAKHFPETIAQRRKQGFGVPVDQLLRSNASLVSDILIGELNKHQDYLHTAMILELWHQHQSLQKNHGETILTILLFLVWHKHNLQTA